MFLQIEIKNFNLVKFLSIKKNMFFFQLNDTDIAVWGTDCNAVVHSEVKSKQFISSLSADSAMW